MPADPLSAAPGRRRSFQWTRYPSTPYLPIPGPRLPRYRDPRNLVRFLHLPHTRLTYHRTWETGLETEIRVAAFSPAFFCLALLCIFPVPLCAPVVKPFLPRQTERC